MAGTKSVKPKPAPAASAVEVVPIGDLCPDPANLRRHPERNVAAVDASFARFGPARSVVIDGNGVVRAGNRSLESARAAGVTDVLVVDPAPGQLVAVRRRDWSPTEATAYGIADNRAAEHATWDDVALAETLRSLQSEDFDLGDVGFTGDELDGLCGRLADGLVIPDPEPQAEPGLKAEHFVEIYCSAAALEDFRATLDEWGSRGGVTVHIS